ncbi:mitochondrial genome maintenance exonuclease 1-like [Anopheles bellator]|uniref:mitochondrial genome maintenance exonuclease 1-like n=1 Tax=Anopheles bellator TaxID=139047 RepID=UPI002647A385|nr:mitochondrial genome maintenance exonuclease 1-like [Anopheles bellator]
MIQFLLLRTLSTAAKGAEPGVSKAKLIKRLNYENKALFGAVKKATRKQPAEPHEDSRKPSKNETVFSSEIYWQTRSVGRIGEEKKAVPATPVPPLVQNPEPELNSGQLTPFTQQELSWITKFPLLPSPAGILEQKWLLHQQYENQGYKTPSVSRVLAATMSEASRQALLRWKASKIAELGEEGFQQLQKETFERGSNLHTALELWLAGNDPPEAVTEKTSLLWQSVEKALNVVERPAKIIEKKLYHPYLHYNGVVDCITSIKGQCHVIEWKTSDKPKATVAATYDAPIQLCAYLGALQASGELRDTEVQNGAIFVAYTGGIPADVHLLDASKMRRYWNMWLHRLQDYWVRYRDGTLPDPI